MRSEIVQPCEDLEECIAFFAERVGMRLRSVFPADCPVVAVVEREGLSIRLEVGSKAPPATIRVTRNIIACDEVEAPNGTRFLASRSTVLPKARARFGIVPMTDEAFETGRAGMLYRDLVPDRVGGFLIASHIRIPEGGPVPDYVHFHDINFQLIYCWKGRVKLVYEDQGPPFFLETGDCVLQPPGIRHRVLETSDGLDVIELACPAQHPTHLDHELALPTKTLDRQRQIGGQRFVHHVASKSAAGPSRDLELTSASGGLVEARVAEFRGTSAEVEVSDEIAIRLLVVLAGELAFSLEDESTHVLTEGATVAIPSGARSVISGHGEVLDVSVRDVPSDSSVNQTGGAHDELA